MTWAKELLSLFRDYRQVINFYAAGIQSVSDKIAVHAAEAGLRAVCPDDMWDEALNYATYMRVVFDVRRDEALRRVSYTLKRHGTLPERDLWFQLADRTL